jgi:hypothetical protein
MKTIAPLLVATVTVLCSCAHQSEPRVVTSIRNDAGRDLSLTVGVAAGHVETFSIRAGDTGTCDYGGTHWCDDQTDTMIISDGLSRFTFTNITAIIRLPDSLITRSCFFSPWTLHICVASNISVYAVDSHGYVSPQPEGFPIHYAHRQDQR